VALPHTTPGHYRGRDLLKKILALLITLFSITTNALTLDRVYLNVPTVKQGHALCGPATIEMIFRYWGITKYDQYDIAYNILLFNPEAKRVIKSGILETDTIEWKRYPGTGTSTGHYRIVTGYDEYRKEVYLNDANPGKKITQSYDEFFALWNVDEPWLHYNAIAFNISGKRFNIDLNKYSKQRPI
jgi:hypothetical protein